MKECRYEGHTHRTLAREMHRWSEGLSVEAPFPVQRIHTQGTRQTGQNQRRDRATGTRGVLGTVHVGWTEPTPKDFLPPHTPHPGARLPGSHHKPSTRRVPDNFDFCATLFPSDTERLARVRRRAAVPNTHWDTSYDVKQPLFASPALSQADPNIRVHTTAPVAWARGRRMGPRAQGFVSAPGYFCLFGPVVQRATAVAFSSRPSPV